jgi:hypothetical protein
MSIFRLAESLTSLVQKEREGRQHSVGNLQKASCLCLSLKTDEMLRGFLALRIYCSRCA